MSRRRILILGPALLLFMATVWLLWARPKPVDMAQFAPANSLIYIEVNEPAAVLSTLGKTGVWRLLNQQLDVPALSFDGSWQRFFRITGIGPIDSVIFSRSQVAVVVASLNTTESGDVLKVKPEAALIVETHTSERRIRAPIERHLERFVASIYKTSSREQSVIDGVSTVEFRDNAGSGQIVVAFVGSLVVIGNSKDIVNNCVSVARRRAPNLGSNPRLQTARASHDSEKNLAFGYVPAEASARLLSAGVPIFLGQSSQTSQFQHLVQNAASKLIGSLTWSTQSFDGGIEDRYTVELQPDVVAELRPHFGLPQQITAPGLSTEAYSITSYSIASPLATWQSLRTSVSRRVDTVAAVVFNAALKSSLESYGISDPEYFLGAVRSPLKTVRLDQAGERQLLIAPVSHQGKLIDLFKRSMRVTSKSADHSSIMILENSDRTLSVALNESLLVVGHPVDVQQYFRMTVERDVEGKERAERIAAFVNPETQAHIVTYTNDAVRIRSFATTVARLRRLTISSALSEQVDAMPYAISETTLTDRGLMRITRSPLGQFSALVPLVFPNEDQP